MKTNKYSASAGVLIFIVFFIYFFKFYIIEKYKLSNDTAIWGQLGDYAGGILNPLLSFVSIVLLIKSLTLQNEANESLRNELKNSAKTEKIRSFESLFFNLISAQKNLFDSFYIDVSDKNKRVYAAKAVIQIEDRIEEIRGSEGGDKTIIDYLESLDLDDQIFGLSRAFYVAALMISEKLSDKEGFSEEDRRSHFLALINFTDFALIRLILISIQFLSYESCKFLRSSTEFKKTVEELGLSFDLY